MLRISVVLLLVAVATAAPFDDDVNINGSGSFETDVNELLHEVSNKQKNSDYACKDFFSLTCNKTNNEDLQQLTYKDHLAQLYTSEVYNALIDVLNHEIKNEEHPIDIERKLFQSCMNLGNEDNEEVNYEYTTDSTFKNMLQHFNLEINEESWQTLDQKLALQGFKHSFFEINVVKDSETPNKNIIRLSPPSMTEWNFKKLTDVVSDIFTQQQLDAREACANNQESSDENNFDNSIVKSDDDSVFWDSEEEENESRTEIPDDGSGYADTENEIENDVSSDTEKQNDENGNTSTENEIESADVNEFCLLYKNMDQKRDLTTFYVRKQDTTVMGILNLLLKGIFNTMDTSNEAHKVQRLTIDEWNRMYKKLVKKDTATIDWYHVLKSYFENLNIHVKNTEYILIENVPYFFKLAELLSFKYYTDEDIAHAIRSKFVGENMRYYNWNMVNNMHPVDKPSFCLEQNKFYAASANVLKHLKSKMKPYEKKVESLLYDIAGALHYNISSTTISEHMKTNLLSNLKDLTKDPFKTIDHVEMSEYYKDFKLTGDYLVDINNYKNIMRNINLLKLRDASLSLHRSSPFSVLETENPRNRYILHSALNAIIYKQKFLLNKGSLYGTFGVKSASFLFALLSEKTFENGLRDLQGISSIIPQLSYKPEKVACFVNKNIVQYGYLVDYDIITDVYGIRFAYAALLHHLKSESAEEFFTAYTQDHCAENDSKMITKVLSNVHEFPGALKCTKNEDTACNLQAF